MQIHLLSTECDWLVSWFRGRLTDRCGKPEQGQCLVEALLVQYSTPKSGRTPQTSLGGLGNVKSKWAMFSSSQQPRWPLRPVVTAARVQFWVLSTSFENESTKDQKVYLFDTDRTSEGFRKSVLFSCQLAVHPWSRLWLAADGNFPSWHLSSLKNIFFPVCALSHAACPHPSFICLHRMLDKRAESPSVFKQL